MRQIKYLADDAATLTAALSNLHSSPSQGYSLQVQQVGRLQGMRLENARIPSVGVFALIRSEV
jgi:hypothetical protein